MGFIDFYAAMVNVVNNPSEEDVDMARLMVKDAIDDKVCLDQREYEFGHPLVNYLSNIDTMLNDGHTLKSKFQFYFAMLLYMKAGLYVFFGSYQKCDTLDRFINYWNEVE